MKAKSGPLSASDFALYLEAKNKKKIFAIKLQLLSEIGLLPGSDKIDLVILNTIEAPELKDDIIKEGKYIFVREPYKILASQES